MIFFVMRKLRCLFGLKLLRFLLAQSSLSCSLKPSYVVFRDYKIYHVSVHTVPQAPSLAGIRVWVPESWPALKKKVRFFLGVVMQIHSSHVNTGFMELPKLAWKEGRKAVLEGSRGKEAKMCYLPNCEITSFMLQAPDCTPSCRILQLPLMGFQWHVSGGRTKSKELQ